MLFLTFFTLKDKYICFTIEEFKALLQIFGVDVKTVLSYEYE